MTRVLLLTLLSCASVLADDSKPPSAGERLFLKQCASCHGKEGEGVKRKYKRPLTGDLSVRQLAKYIEKWMPEDAPENVVGKDAERVARYIYDRFYSAIAQARRRPPRVELVRLTVPQYRNAVADLVGAFRRGLASPRHDREPSGLRGEYFNSRRPGSARVFERRDAVVQFDFLRENPSPKKLGTQGFAARWSGSVLAPATGRYEFIVRTDHAARLWVNDPNDPLIDAWVKSGSGTEFRGTRYLLAGRLYALRLEFSSRDQGVKKDRKSKKPIQAFIELHWKPPHHAVSLIPARQLRPRGAQEILVCETPFPPDDRSVGYERGSSISKAWDDATTAAAVETARYIIEHLDALAGTGRDGSRAEKVRDFAHRLVTLAFRRPLSGEQKELYVERQFAGAPDLETAVKRVVLLTLKSPRFLYLGLDDADDENADDAYARAERLSFALWDSLPDQALLDAAGAGALSERKQLAAQATRMIADRRSRAKMRQFLHHWLDIESDHDLGKNKDAFPEFDATLISDLRTSLDLFLDDVIWSEGADFRRLLRANDIFINGRLARFYGFDLPPSADFQKLRARNPQRVGVLSHPYMMARFAYTDATSPIHRGVFLSRGVLGRGLRPPPEAFAPLAADLHPGLTTRERVELQTKPQACRGCHSLINPLGFALERFDAVGRLRERENDKPIDARGLYEQLSGETARFNGAAELAEFLAASDETHTAFVTQLFHHLVKQSVFAYGAGVPAALRQDFATSGYNVRWLIVEIGTVAALGSGDNGDNGDNGVTAGGRVIRERAF